MQKIMAICLLCFCIVVVGCSQAAAQIDYKFEMQLLVKEISKYAKAKSSSFQVIVNNGIGLLDDKAGKKANAEEFMSSIDGLLLESYYYGWEMKDNNESPEDARDQIAGQIGELRSSGKAILSVDYCFEPRKVDNTYSQNNQQGIIAFAANSRQLDTIPQYPKALNNENGDSIASLLQAKNQLILLNPQNYVDKASYLAALQNTNYDLLIIDAYYNEKPLSQQEVNSLKVKKNGASRLVYAYMSVGEAEDYRNYWHTEWSKKPPSWIAVSNNDWPGNYKVKYWDKQWKKILFGSTNAYLDNILAAGFDGVFLDVVDAYEYFLQ